jgi:hypothetical protein
MFEHRDPSGNQFRTCEVDADDFYLYDGDRLPPGFEIGIDTRTGAIIYMDTWGRVATVYYNPMNHSYLVMIQIISTIDNTGDCEVGEMEMSLF